MGVVIVEGRNTCAASSASSCPQVKTNLQLANCINFTKFVLSSGLMYTRNLEQI